MFANFTKPLDKIQTDLGRLSKFDKESSTFPYLLHVEHKYQNQR